MDQNNTHMSVRPYHKFYLDFDDWLVQKIEPSRQEKITNIYHFYKKFNLEKLGFIKADLTCQDGEMFLKTKKYINSYPNEWTMSMLKDATLFHLKLFEKLYSLNLALKSSSLQNIVFDCTKPIFSDLKTLSMRDEETLLPLSLNEGELEKVVHQILLVVELIQQKKYHLIREILEEHRGLIFRKKMFDLFSQNPGLKTSWEESVALHSAKLITKKSFVDQCEYLHSLATSINVSPENKFYPSYYENKGEDFDLNNMADWTERQRNVYKLITNHCPNTVLNVGASTGWFSFLAEREGARVISTDTDESAIDFLYLKSKTDNLNMLSLAMPFASISERVSCDMVLALGILHNLVFEQNMQLDYIFKTLSMATKNILILEFVDLTTQSNNANAATKIKYTLDFAVKSGSKYFSNVEVLDSHPQSRKLLVFKK